MRRLGALVIVGLFAVLQGCTNSSGPSTTTPSGGSSGGTSTSAKGGSSGETSVAASGGSSGGTSNGASGAGATDGAAPDYPNATDGAAPDRSRATDTTDGAVAMTPTELCQTAIRLQVESLSVCQGGSQEERFALANLCPDSYFNADSNRTVASVAACLGLLAARSCTDVALNFLPSCLASGTRPVGAGCSYSSQCQTNICAGAGGSCPVCLPARIPIDSPCVSGYCQDGSFCHLATGLCTDAATIVYASQGQPCNLFAKPVVGCAGDLLCLSGSDVSTFGVCTPIPGAGQPCALSTTGNMLCAAGTTCLGVSGTNTCTLETCGAGPPCDEASYCAAGDGGFACVPQPTVGQPCDALSVPCLSPAVCVGSTGKCAIPRALGETCDADNPCADLLSCLAGTCRPTASANCPAGGGDGGTG